MNINRDYLIINDVKKSNVKLDNGSMFFYITDKNTQNIFVNLVINVSNNDLIQKYANIENAEDYTLTMNIVKPDNDYKIIEGKLHDKEKAIFEFDLKEDCVDKIGPYRCELLTKCTINGHEEITTSNKITYKVKSSILNDLDDIVEAPEYPLVIQLFDKLRDIDQYEEDRRANELARQLAEEQRQTRFDTLDVDMVNRIQAMDNKVVDVENRVSAKEQAVNTLIADTKADIDGYKVAKDQEIDNYKATKDTEINEAIASQNTVINAQNDRIIVVENNVVAQNDKIDALETKATTHEARITAVEAKDTEQDSRLDVAENRLNNIGNDITNTMQPIIDGHTARLDAIEAIDVVQNTRLDAIEAKNQQQDDRLLDIEKVNKRQDIDIKCLYGASQTIDVTKEGNSIYLQNSNNGFVAIDEIKGNTLVNCNKEPDKELILNGNINTSGDNTVTLTEGVDGGLVDVALEGNTLVNVSKTKDSTAITKAYTVENSGNHVALQGDVDGNCRPVITGNTLWIDNDTEGVLTAFDETKNLRLQSSFEDNLVTQEMVDNGEEVTDNLGKYRVDYKVTGKNLFDANKLNLLVNQCNNGITVSIENGKLYIEGTTTEIYDFRPVSPVYNKVSFDKVNSAPAGTSFTLSNNIDGMNYWRVIRDGKTQYIANTITKQQGDSNIDAFVRIMKDISISKREFNIQVEEGNTATAYEPYKEYTKTLYLNSPLLEGDTIEEKDDGIYHVHRSKEMSITEIKDISNTTRINLTAYDTCNDIRFIINKPLNISSPQIFSHFKYRNGTGVLGEAVVVSTANATLFIFHFSKDITTVDDFMSIYGNSKVVFPITTPQYELIEQSNLAIPSYANGHLALDTAVPVEKVEFKPFSEELTYLYANTQYTVQFISYKAITADITLGGTQLLAQSIVKGLNRISITTPATLTDNKLIISGVGANIMEVIVTDIDRELIYFEGMKSVGEGKELQVISINSDKHLANTQQLTHEPLRAVGDAKDRYVLIDGKWYVERKCGVRVYQEGDEDNYKTDLVNTVYPLEMPTYEEIDYSPLEVYSGTTHITTNSTIPTNIIVKNHGFNCLLKPSTTYTISSNLGLNTVTTPSTLTEDCLRFMDTDTSDVTTMRDVLVLEGDWTTKADLIPSNFSGIESTFEQEYDAEKGKYKVNVKVANEDKTKENNITFYINEPLRGVGDTKDKVFIKDDKVVVQRNCGIRAYEDGDFGTYLTDKIDTVYPLAEPTYEEVEYNDTKLFIESFKNSTLFYNNNVPVTSTVHYSYSVPIVDTVAQTANVTDQQDSMIIDLATQCAVMEMMLM